MKKTVFLIAAILAVCSAGFAGCRSASSGNGGNAEDLQPRTLIEEERGEENPDDVENEDDKDKKPPHCENRIPHKRHDGDNKPHPIPRPMPRHGNNEKR